MNVLDLFDTVYERALNEGAVDDLEARYIHGLNTKMLDLMARARSADPAHKQALKREYEKIKSERDSYYKVREDSHMYQGPHGRQDVERKNGVTRVSRRDWDDSLNATTHIPGGKYFPNKDIKGQGTGSGVKSGSGVSSTKGSMRKYPRLDHDGNNTPNYQVDETGIPGEKDYAYHRAKERQHELAGDKLMAKAKSFGAHAHPTGIAARKKAEQHYAKADEHRAAWKELGSKPLKEGSMKRWLWSEAERLEKEDFIANADDYGMSEQEAAEFWDSINGAFDEAGIPGNVPTEKIPGKEELLKGRGRTYYEADQVNEYFVRSGDDIMSVMSLNLFKDLLGDASLSNHDEEFADSPEWQAVVDKWQPKAEHLQKELAKYQSAGRKLRDAEADAIDATVYDGGDAYEDAETAASFLPKVYAKQASAVVRLLKDGYANPPADMHEDDSRIVSQNPAPTPLTPKQELEDRARQVRRKKQDLLKRFANGGVIVEIEWALEHNVFMTKEQMLDYLDHTIEDPDLEPIEYMHDKGFTSDSMVKGLFKRLVGLGLSKSQILGIIKNGDQGKPASPSLISRIAGQVLRSEVSENQAFVPAVGDEIMWRPKNAKMAPTPVTVVATTTDKLKIKLQSPRMIQNAGKDTVVVSIKDSDIFPKPVTEQQSQRPPAKGLLKGKDLITPQQRMAGATPQKPGVAGAVKDVAKGLKNFLQGKPETGPTYEAQKKSSETVDEHGGGIGPKKHWQSMMPETQHINEIKDTEAVEQAILKRIMVAHRDMLVKYGPEKIMTAASDVAYNVGDIGEVGSSDVSGWVRQVEQILGVPEDPYYDDPDEFGMPGSEFFPNEKLDEKQSAKNKPSLRDPKDNPCWKGYHPVGTKKKAGRTVPNCVPNVKK